MPNPYPNHAKPLPEQCLLLYPLTPMKELEDIEIQLLLEGIYRYYGFDFRNYAMASLKRRIGNIMQTEQLKTISGLQEKVLHDSECLERFLLGISVNVNAMFRDPSFYLAFRAKAVPLLRTYPSIRIWHVGCSTGEEVYSMAILLFEEGLYHRCRIYATDMNEFVIRRAKAGILSLDDIREYSQLYLQAGGRKSFSEYYTATSDYATLASFLKKNIIFSPYNLASDASFNEFHVILCRNILIYFNQQLQERVHKLLFESLTMFGILGLGRREVLQQTPYELCYEELDAHEKLYRRIS